MAEQLKTVVDRLLSGLLGDAEHADIDVGGRNFPLGQLVLGHMGGEFQAVQMGQGALPSGERRRPVAAMGDVCVCHFGDLSR